MADHASHSDDIPALAELQALDQWVGWKRRPKPDDPDDYEKPPMNPRTGRYADVTDRKDWGSYEEARAAVKKYNLDGIGFVFTEADTYVGIDLDDCLDPDTGEFISPDAKSWVQTLDSYTEVSPSGTGVKVFAKATGSLPKSLAHKNNGFALEVYTRERYFTFTGDRLPRSPEEIRDASFVVKRLFLDYGADSADANSGPKLKLKKGERDVGLTREMGRMQRAGWPEEASLKALHALNETVCDPPLDRDSVERIHKSIGKKPAGEFKIDSGPRRFTFLTREALLTRPDPTFLVRDVLIENTLAAIVAPYSSYKSFVALGIAGAVATGQGWAGRETRRHPVLYISAEGSAGIKRRVQAWESEHGADAGELVIVPEAPNLLDPGDTGALLEGIEAMPAKPGLIVVDTLARCMVGGDENSAKDMGRFVQGCDRLRLATVATVLILHHVNKQNGGTRGSTALPGALDTIVHAERQNGPIHGAAGSNGVALTCGKQKDYAEFDPIYFMTEVIPLPGGETSLILSHVSDFRMDLKTGKLTPKQTAALDALKDFGDQGATVADWKKAAEALDVRGKTFYRAKDELMARGLVVESGGRCAAAGEQG